MTSRYVLRHSETGAFAVTSDPRSGETHDFEVAIQWEQYASAERVRASKWIGTGFHVEAVNEDGSSPFA